MSTCPTRSRPHRRVFQTSQSEFCCSSNPWQRATRRSRITWSRRMKWKSRTRGHKRSSSWKQVRQRSGLISAVGMTFGECVQLWIPYLPNVCSAEVVDCERRPLLFHSCRGSTTFASTAVQGEMQQNALTKNKRWFLTNHFSAFSSRLLQLRTTTATMNWREMPKPACLWCLRNFSTQSRSQWFSVFSRRWDTTKLFCLLMCLGVTEAPIV